MQTDRIATLILDDGTTFRGYSFGYEKPVAGEVVFNTAMTGYPESLTDPSYAGQLMVLTYPLIGNYGVPPRTFQPNGLSTFMESEKIHAEAIIISDYSREYSHWNAQCSLGDWLKEEHIPGIYGIDTRALTKKLREHGVMMGRIEIEGMDNGEVTMDNYGEVNYVDKVSCKDILVYSGEESHTFGIDTPAETLNSQLSILNCLLKKKVVLLDCGVKHNIIRSLLKRNLMVVRVPWNYDFNGTTTSTTWTTTGSSSATDRATPIPATLPYKTSARLSPATVLSAASAWATSSWQRLAAPLSTN